jgi:hypothetical protein
MRGTRSLLPPLLVLVLTAALPAVAQERHDLAIKARIALAIIRFVEFPEVRSGGRPLQFCVAMGGAVPPSFLQLVRQGGSIEVVDLKGEVAATACNVLYIDSSADNWRRLLGTARTGLLTIGDAPGFLAAGGAIELVQANDAVSFDVNQQELRRQGIRLPAQVLRLARTVLE